MGFEAFDQESGRVRTAPHVYYAAGIYVFHAYRLDGMSIGQLGETQNRVHGTTDQCCFLRTYYKPANHTFPLQTIDREGYLRKREQFSGRILIFPVGDAGHHAR
jgi:hypothetical protein